MSINVLMNETGTEPLRAEDEYFILKRNDISYRITVEGKGQYNGEGYLILTSYRLVIIPTKQNTHFRAIEIPLNQIYQEEFKQPLFGKSYLTAKCNRIPSSPFDSFTFTIWFKGSRMGTLIGAFYTLIDSLRNNQGRNHDERVIRCLQNNCFNELFAIDLEDNSLIYQMQPISAKIPRQNFQSVIINRPPDLNNFIRRNNNNNFNQQNNNINSNININNEINNNIQSDMNDIENNNNNIYMSTFVYRNPKPNTFVYKDPGFVYKPPKVNIANDDDDLESPYIPKSNNNNNNRNNNGVINNNRNNNINYNRNNINIQNPNVIRNNMNNLNLQNPYMMRNNINYISNQNPNQVRNYPPPNYNNNIQMNNQPYMNNQNQNIIQNNRINNNRNIPMSSTNQINHPYNNPYSQIKNNPLEEEEKNEKINKNNNNKQLYKVNKGSGKYQNLKEEEYNNIDNNENSINNVTYSINDGENSERFNIYLDNNQDQNLLHRLNSDDLIPDSKVDNPYN